jgi:cytochrome b
MKTYIWGLPTRLFHWLLAIGFAAAYLLADADNLKNLHFAFGAFTGTLLFFRLLFGFFGPKYSRFSDFPMGIKNQIEFAKTFFAKTKEYAGHNPAASVVMLLIILVGILCSFSGYLIYSTENKIFSLGFDPDFLEEAHEVLANIFLILVGMHLLGILADTLFHSKTGTLKSMFTGYKNVQAENVRLNSFQKIFGFLWLIIPVVMFIYAESFQVNEQKGNKLESEETEKPESETEDEED